MAVPGMRTFAILDPRAPENDWCGRPFSPDSMAMFAKDGEFQSVSQPGFDVHTLSFTDEQLTTACEQLGIPDVTRMFSDSGAILKLDRRQTSKIRMLVDSAVYSLCGTGLRGSRWIDHDHIRDKISEHPVMLLSNGSYLTRTPSQRLR